MSETVTLYSFADVDRSSRARWLMAELGLPVEERRLNYMEAEHKSADYRRHNPFGVVPTAQLDGQTVFESGAICLYLADRYGAGALAPKADDPDRAAYYQWLVWASATLDPAVFKIFGPGKTHTPEELAAHRESVRPLLDGLSAHLETRDYVLGKRFSAADIVIGHVLELGGRFTLLDGHPVLKAYVARLAAREGAKASRLFTAPLPGQA